MLCHAGPTPDKLLTNSDLKATRLFIGIQLLGRSQEDGRGGGGGGGGGLCAGVHPSEAESSHGDLDKMNWGPPVQSAELQNSLIIGWDLSCPSYPGPPAGPAVASSGPLSACEHLWAACTSRQLSAVPQPRALPA